MTFDVGASAGTPEDVISTRLDMTLDELIQTRRKELKMTTKKAKAEELKKAKDEQRLSASKAKRAAKLNAKRGLAPVVGPADNAGTLPGKANKAAKAAKAKKPETKATKDKAKTKRTANPETKAFLDDEDLNILPPKATRRSATLKIKRVRRVPKKQPNRTQQRLTQQTLAQQTLAQQKPGQQALMQPKLKLTQQMLAQQKQKLKQQKAPPQPKKKPTQLTYTATEDPTMITIILPTPATTGGNPVKAQRRVLRVPAQGDNAQGPQDLARRVQRIVKIVEKKARKAGVKAKVEVLGHEQAAAAAAAAWPAAVGARSKKTQGKGTQKLAAKKETPLTKKKLLTKRRTHTVVMGY